MKNILLEKINCVLFSIILFSFLLFSSKVSAVTVNNIEIDPPSPVYDTLFSCVFSVDVDEPNLACGLRPLGASATQNPWDICPKKGETGHRYTENNKRYYRCIANADTKVPGPGRYEIVAWEFWADGAYGKVITSKEITIIDKPPPTATPLPTPTPTLTPTAIPAPIEPQTESFWPSPTPNQRINNNNIDFVIPTVERNIYNEAPKKSQPSSNVNFSSSLSLINDFLNWEKNISVNALYLTKNATKDITGLFNRIIFNFLNETSF